jgi:hypothetical protein
VVTIVGSVWALACGGERSVTTPDTPYPHEPPGATVLIDWDFDVSNAGNPPFFYTAGIPPAQTVTDVTAPVNPSKVGRIEFNPSLPGGTGPSALASNQLPPSNWKTWYSSMWVKVSANYVNEMGFPGLKIWDMLTHSPDGSIILQFYGRTAPFTTLLTIKPQPGVDHFGNIPMQANVWYQLVAHDRLGTPATRPRQWRAGFECGDDQRQ